jgi:hypothetical protein
VEPGVAEFRQHDGVRRAADRDGSHTPSNVLRSQWIYY